MFTDRQEALVQVFVGQGYAHADAQAAALKMIDGAVQIQATVIAYDTAFLVSGAVFVLALPLVFFLKKGDASKAAGGGH